jgi:hypothetical protein
VNIRKPSGRGFTFGVVALVAAIMTACGSDAPAAAPTATTLPASTEVAATVVPRPTATAETVPSTDPAATAQPAPTAAASAPPTAAPTDQTTSDDAAPSGPVALTWEIQEIDTGTKPAIALSSDGTPNVAYMLEAMPGFVKNAVLNGDSWDITTVVDGYLYGPLDIVIGPDDIPHITYHDHQDERQFRPELGDAVHAYRAPDGEWRVEAAFGQGHDGWDNRITVDAEGRPHMSAIDPLEFAGDGVTYYRRNGPGNWTVESIGSGDLTYKYSTSIAVDPEGVPHITYYDQGGNDLALASRGNNGWDIAHIDTDGETGLFSSLVIDADGRFHVSYFEKKSPSRGIVKYATRAPGETDWTILEVGTLDHLAFGFIGARNITSIAIDDAGNPWIAYSDETRVMLAIWRGSEWQVEIVAESPAEDLGQLVSLKLDAGGDPHIAYFRVTSRSPLNGVIMYAKGSSSP